MSIQEFHDKIVGCQPIDLHDYVQEIPELKRLQETNQNPTYHAEGNVLIHTNMVLEQAMKIITEEVHTKPFRDNLYLSCLIHDLGKPDTTFFNEKKNKIVSYNHEHVGVPVGREFLRKYFPEIGYARREYLLSLVEYHLVPRNMVKEEADLLRYKKLSLEVDTELLYNLSKCDFLGRIGERVPEAMEQLEKFKEICIANDIFGKYYTLPNSQGVHQFIYSQARWDVLFKNIPEDKAIERATKLINIEKPFELMLLVGIPGSGKTTYREKFYPKVTCLCMDEERARLGDVNDMSKNQEIFNSLLRRLRVLMQKRVNVIWDATSIDRKMRKILIDTARSNGALVEVVYFDLPLEVSLKRNSERSRVVPEDVLKNYHRRLQSPKPYEYTALRVVNEFC